MFALKEEIPFVIHNFYIGRSKIHKVEHETTRRTFVFVHWIYSPLEAFARASKATKIITDDKNSRAEPDAEEIARRVEHGVRERCRRTAL